MPAPGNVAIQGDPILYPRRHGISTHLSLPQPHPALGGGQDQHSNMHLRHRFPSELHRRVWREVLAPRIERQPILRPILQRLWSMGHGSGCSLRGGRGVQVGRVGAY